MSGGLKHVFVGDRAPMGLQIDVTRADGSSADFTTYTAVRIECELPNGKVRSFPAVVATPPAGLALTPTTISVLRIYDGTEWLDCGLGDAIARAYVDVPGGGEVGSDPVDFEVRDKFGRR